VAGARPLLVQFYSCRVGVRRCHGDVAAASSPLERLVRAPHARDLAGDAKYSPPGRKWTSIYASTHCLPEVCVCGWIDLVARLTVTHKLGIAQLFSLFVMKLIYSDLI
jgi:hypothetical protein